MSTLINLVSDVQSTAHTVGSKILMGISAPNIVYQLNEALPSFIAEPVIWMLARFYAIEWVEGLSTLAIVMLIVERFYATKLNIAKRKAIEENE
tara:strand:- start:440 stop:721 length:282 start_codon:yes stop_codon:yes gene_type:complete